MGHGGKRPGAGRKPKAATIIRAKAIEEAGDDAKYALGLFVETMRDDSQPNRVRLECAEQVMDRVWGRPTQRQEAKVEATVTHAIDGDTAESIFDILAGAGALSAGAGNAEADAVRPTPANR